MSLALSLSLQSRGADFGDSESLYMTYRNVSPLFFGITLTLDPTGSHYRCPRGAPCSVIGRVTTLPQSQRRPCDFKWYVLTAALPLTIRPAQSANRRSPPAQWLQAYSSSRARARGRRTRPSAGTAATRSRAPSCAACSTQSRLNCSRPRTVERATRPCPPQTAFSESWRVFSCFAFPAVMMCIGTCHRVLRKPPDAGAHICLWRAVRSRWTRRDAAAVQQDYGHGFYLGALLPVY